KPSDEQPILYHATAGVVKPRFSACAEVLPPLYHFKVAGRWEKDYTDSRVLPRPCPGGEYPRSEECPMLPCQTGCPSYREGCHKTCPQW
ncbi:PH domain-containing protein, partial [Dysosmobacter welbionis]